MARERLVVIGNGMAGCRAIEEVLARDPDRYEITVFGAEPRVNYDRIVLSPVLAGQKTFADFVSMTRPGTVTTASGCCPASRSRPSIRS
jgi:nitrite reductase (NADH) large subunit